MSFPSNYLGITLLKIDNNLICTSRTTRDMAAVLIGNIVAEELQNPLNNSKALGWKNLDKVCAIEQYYYFRQVLIIQKQREGKNEIFANRATI